MQRRNAFLVLALTVILAGVGYALIGRVRSQSPSVPDQAPPAALATPRPATDGQGFGTVEVGPAMPNPPALPTSERPAAATLPAAPTLAPAPAGENSKLDLAFNAAPDLQGWLFGQVFVGAIKPPEWNIQDGRLVAPDNSRAVEAFNDTLAVLPAPLSGNGAIEVSALAGTASKIGLLVGYRDDQNYTALIFGASDAPGYAGAQIVQVRAGAPTVLASDPKALLERNQWYRLRLSIDGLDVRASIDGTTLLATTLPAKPAGQRVGVYAGSEGYAFFDNLRVLEK